MSVKGACARAEALAELQVWEALEEPVRVEDLVMWETQRQVNSNGRIMLIRKPELLLCAPDLQHIEVRLLPLLQTQDVCF